MDEHAYNFKWTLKKCPCFYCRHYDRSTFITTIEFMFSKLLYSSWQIILFHSNYGFSILLLLCTLRITEIFSRSPIRILDKLQTTQDKWPSRRAIPSSLLRKNRRFPIFGSVGSLSWKKNPRQTSLSRKGNWKDFVVSRDGNDLIQMSKNVTRTYLSDLLPLSVSSILKLVTSWWQNGCISPSFTFVDMKPWGEFSSSSSVIREKFLSPTSPSRCLFISHWLLISEFINKTITKAIKMEYLHWHNPVWALS